MQRATQPKSDSPKCIREAEFDCKYSEHVYLFYLALFILKQNFSWDRYSATPTLYVHDPQQPVPWICTLPSIINIPTKFDLGWCTPLMTSIYSDHHSSMVALITRTIGFKVKNNNKPLAIENNLYTSKLMVVVPHVPMYHVI
jgi:hypothetical protein